MSYEYQKIQKTIKALMKGKKTTYQSLARLFKVSPATIKRRLNGDDLTIQQIKDFAEALSVSFYELIELSKRSSREPFLFTQEQEKLLSSRLWIMMLFRFTLGGLDFAEIKSRLKVSEIELRKVARDLENVGLAKLLPGDRFVALVHFPFKWQRGGLLEKAYNDMILDNIMSRIRNNRDTAGISKRFEFALSPEIYKNFCSEIEGIFLKYRDFSEIHLSSKLNFELLVSGCFYVDQFSVWETSGRTI